MSIASIVNSAKSRRQTIMSVGWVTGAQFLATGLTMTSGLIQARYIAPEVLGFYTVFTILSGYITFLHMGTLTALQRDYPYWLGRGDHERAAKSAAVTQGWILVICATTCLLYLSLVIWALLRGDWMASAGWAAQIITASGGFYTLYLGCTYRSTSEFVTWSKVTLTGAILATATLPLVAWYGYWGMCLRAFIAPALALYLLHRYRPLHVKPRLDLKLLWEQLRSSFPMDIAGFMATSCMAATLNMMVLAKYGTAALGLFAFARVAEAMMQQLGSSVTQVFLPRINMRMGQTESLRACSAYAIKATVPCLVVTVIVTMVAAFLCRPTVMLLVPRYEGAVSLMQLFLWIGLHPVLMMPRQVLIAGKKTLLVVVSSVATFAVFALGGWAVMVLDMPMIWMAAAYLGGKLVNTVVCNVLVWHVGQQEGRREVENALA